MMLPVASVLFSGALIVPLCLGDPKRRRTSGLDGDEMPAVRRRLLSGAACLPALLCALLGDAAALMIWLGGCAVIGWFVALWFGQAGKDAA